MKKITVLLLCALMLVSLVACGGESDAGNAASGNVVSDNTVTLDVTAAYEKLTQAATLPEMLELDAGMMLDYCGIKEADVTAAKVLICADSLRTDEIWLIQAKDAAAADTIVKLAEKRLEKKGEESITYSPEQYAVVEKAELLRQGNFVALIVSPDVATLADAFRQYAGL